VTGSSAANAAAEAADLIVGIGTRLQDFTTGSRALFGAPGRKLVQVNVAPHDAHKHGATSVVGDAGAVIAALAERLDGWKTPVAWTVESAGRIAGWNAIFDAATAPDDRALPTDAQVLGAVSRAASDDAVVVCAAGGLPGELHKLWRTKQPGGYHVEYGFSCMGYEIAGAVGVKMAAPDREVHVMVGDGSYLMLNSELATSVMLGTKLIVTVLDNRGYGCINRLQAATGGAPFNNLLADTVHQALPDIDFAAHAASLGARSEKVESLAELEAALQRAKAATAPMSLSSTPTPCRPPRAAAPGGTWRCQKSRCDRQ
jgi:3D-(3,5/4)-trihydroxycyclohexane-1,2-dione acylhydrolase (decyclizing)